jgi:hypothetical protein
MTHDELIEKIEDEISNCIGLMAGATLGEALKAVVELHKPFNIDTDKPLCPRCTEPDLSLKGNPILVMAPYPCPTIQAIEKELG